VYDSTVITVPNAFSPNGDGINDTWRLAVQGAVANYSLTIFNRYGQVVFNTNDITKAWDGAVNGTPLPAATYYYIILGLGTNSRPIKQSGYVVIVR
jgi:gliding motility-associated-like protein